MANKKFIYNKDKHEKMLSQVLESGIGEEISASFPGFSVTHVVNRFRKEGRMNDYLMLRKLAYGGLTVIPSRKERNVEYVIQIKSSVEPGTGRVRNHICDYREMRYMPEHNCYRAMDSVSIRKQLERIGVPENRWGEYFAEGCLEGPIGDGKVVCSYPDGMPIAQDMDSVRHLLSKRYQNNVFHFNGKPFPFNEQEAELMVNGYSVTLKKGGEEIRVRYNVFAGIITPCYEIGKALRVELASAKRERARKEESLVKEGEVRMEENQSTPNTYVTNTKESPQNQTQHQTPTQELALA